MPHRGVMNWITDVPADQLFLSAVTIGEIQVGIENIRERDPEKADEIADWLHEIVATYRVLPMDAAAFQEWARLMHGKRDNLLIDAMIAATAKLHTLIVATRDTGDFSEFGVDLIDPFLRRINGA